MYVNLRTVMILGRFTGGADLEARVASDEGLALVPASAASAGTDGCGEQAEGTPGCAWP